MKLNVIDLMEDLRITVELARRVVKFEAEQLAAADPADLQLVLAPCHELLARKIIAYARLKTGANAPLVAIASTEPPQDSVVALYALIGKAVVAWTLAKLTDAHLVQVGSTHVWVQLTGLDLQMSWMRSRDPNSKILVEDPVSLYKFLGLAGDKYWNLSATALLQSLVDYAEAYD